MINEQLTKLCKTVTDREQSKVSDLVLSQNQSFDSVEILEAGDVFIIDV